VIRARLRQPTAVKWRPATPPRRSCQDDAPHPGWPIPPKLTRSEAKGAVERPAESASGQVAVVGNTQGHPARLQLASKLTRIGWAIHPREGLRPSCRRWRHLRGFGGFLHTSPKIGPKSREECELGTGRTRRGRCNFSKFERGRNGRGDNTSASCDTTSEPKTGGFAGRRRLRISLSSR
jgi:hypothetical protein